MAIDAAGTQKAALALVTNKSLSQAGVCVPMISAKSIWNAQAVGTYDLIDPYLHVDYPNRTEVQTAIQEAFSSHQGKGAHLPWGSPEVIKPLIMVPKFIMISKLSRKIPPPPTAPLPSSVAMMQDAGLMPEPGAMPPIQMMVRAGSPLAGTGYGV